MTTDTRRLIVTIIVAVGGALAAVYSDQKWALVAGSAATTLATAYGWQQHKQRKKTAKTDIKETPK